MVNIGFLAVSVFCTLSLLIAFLWMGVASGAKQGNRNAADAAALAAAGAFAGPAGQAHFAPGFTDGQDLRNQVRRSGGCPAQVRDAAATYATKNGAALTGCRVIEWGVVEVTTRMEVPIEGASDGRSRARADWSLDWTSCLIDPEFTAPETGPTETWMRCGGDVLNLRYDGERFFLHPWGQVEDMIDRQVRLVR